MIEQDAPPPATNRDDGPSVARVLRRNIQALRQMRADFTQRSRLQDRLADAITRFAGSMAFVILHAAAVLAWFLLNTRVFSGITPFDPYPFVVLAVAASVEAIFLSTFVLISQNRMSKLADRRDELNVQTSLLAEHEITRVLQLTDAIARRLGVAADVSPRELDELKRDVAPETVLSEIEKSEGDAR